MIIYTQPLNFSSYLMWLVTAFVAAVLLLLTAGIVVQLHRRKRREQLRKQIREQWNNLLANLLMDEDTVNNNIVLPESFTAELKKPFVRSVLASELVRTHQSLRGQMAETVVAVYNQLGLYNHSAQLLKSRKWHRKAKGIQQLSTMAQHQYYDAIYKRVNHANTWVRTEAQLGLIRLHGVQGLQFLENVRQPLSEWHQFALLHQLQLQQSPDLPRIGIWLQSTNSSVVVFALRLCQVYQLFDAVPQIVQLQQHADPYVCASAQKCMAEWGLTDLLLHESKEVRKGQLKHQVQTASSL